LVGLPRPYFGSATDYHEAINYRLKSEDIAYIFDHADVDAILVDAEFEHLLNGFRRDHPAIPLLIDTDTDASRGLSAGPYDEAVLEGLEYDREIGSQGWDGLETQAPDEEAVMALAYTSGTTAKPKGVEYTHRGAYMGAMGNVIESGLNYHKGRCRYLWTLPMFHAMGMENLVELTASC
jgi:long-subunit acyl-CoA synthetase (AMP-forming)